MQYISNSAFFQALGYAIGSSLWQAALLWLVVILLNSFLKNSANARYGIAVIAQLTTLVCFAVSFGYYYSHQEEVITNQFQAINSTSFLQLANLSEYINIALPYISLIYIFCLIILSAKWYTTYQKTSQIRKEGLSKPDIDIRLFTSRYAAYMGIQKKVKVYISALVHSPLTVGFLKPIILIPLATINQLTPQQMEAVILHELAHIRRMDYLINMIVSVTEILLFFNPFSQLIIKIIQKERENSCDDWVMQFQYQPTMYAEALLKMAKYQHQTLFTMQANGNKNELLHRIERILYNKQPNYTYKQPAWALLLLLLIATLFSFYQPKGRILFPGENKINTVSNPFSERIQNPLFSPIAYRQPNTSSSKKSASIQKPKTKITTEQKLGNTAIASVLNKQEHQLNNISKYNTQQITKQADSVLKSITINSDELIALQDVFKNYAINIPGYQLSPAMMQMDSTAKNIYHTNQKDTTQQNSAIKKEPKKTIIIYDGNGKKPENITMIIELQ